MAKRRKEPLNLVLLNLTSLEIIILNNKKYILILVNNIIRIE